MLRVFRSVCKDMSADNLDALALVPLEYDLSKIKCPTCKASYSMSAHGSYRRNFTYVKDDTVIDTLIDIRRLSCASCGKTHAVLPGAVVPHSPFSVRFIALLIIDWLQQRYPSVEQLCAHYRIVVNTFYRLKERFEHCVRLAYGLVAGKGVQCEVARILAGVNMHASDELLSEFFKLTNTSFCQSRGP